MIQLVSRKCLEVLLLLVKGKQLLINESFKWPQILGGLPFSTGFRKTIKLTFVKKSLHCGNKLISNPNIINEAEWNTTVEKRCKAFILPSSFSHKKQLSRRMMQLSQWNSEPAQQIYALIQTDATIQSKLGQASSLLSPFLCSHSLPNNTSCLVAWNGRHFHGRKRCLLVLLSDTDRRKSSSDLTGSCRPVTPDNKARACLPPPKKPHQFNLQK